MLFVGAGLLKSIEPCSATRLLGAVVPWLAEDEAVLCVVASSIAETTIGVLLILAPTRRRCVGLGFGLTLALTAFLVAGRARLGASFHCGCFGSLEMPFAVAVARNALMLVVLGWNARAILRALVRHGNA